MADLKSGVTTSFNGGEIAPYLAGRVDHEGFTKCVRKMLNGIPQIGGGVKKFYGTERVCSFFKGFSNYALIPFHHEDSRFLLVLHDGEMDAVIDDVMVSLGIPLPTISDYQSIRYEQVNDVILCCSEDCSPFRIEYIGADGADGALFRIVQVEFDEVPYFPLGYTGNYSGQLEIEGTSGTVVARIPAALQRDTLKISYPKTLPRGSFSTSGNIFRGIRTTSDANFFLEPTIGDITISLVKTLNGETSVVKSGVFNSYSEGRAWVDDKDRKPLDYAHYLYWRANNFSFSTFKNAFISWYGSALEVQPDIYIPVGSIDGYDASAVYEVVISVSASADNEAWNFTSEQTALIQKYGVFLSGASEEYRTVADTAVAAALFSDLNNLVGRKLKIYQNASDSPVAAWYQGMTVKPNETIVWSDGKYYLAKTGTTTKSVQPTHTEGVVSDGGVDWLYLHSGYITATIVSVESEYEMTLLLEPGTSVPVSDLSKTTNYFSTYRWSIWGANAIYPSQIFFNNGRLGFFTNSRYGTYYNFSRSDSYYDFSEDTHGEVLDTDAIQGLVTGGSYSNKINWVISRENVYCGSACTEFVVSGLDGALTPSTVYCKPVSFTGGDKVAALKYMTLSMFVGAGGDNLNVVNYDYSSESYIPQDVSYIAGHLLKDGIKKVVGAPRPDNCIYIATKSGKLVQLVDSVAEGITAFSGIDVGARVLDVAPVFSNNDTFVYVLVVREDAPYGQYFVDIDRFSMMSPTYMLRAETFVADEGETLGPIRVLGKFKNKEVYIKDLDSGMFIKASVPDSGVVTQPFKTTRLQVGLPMPFEIHGIPSVGQKLEGLQQKAVRFLVRLLESGAFSYGSSHDFNRWYEYNNWNIADSQEWDSKHRLMTGDIQLPSSFGYVQGQNTADGPYPNDTSAALNVYSDTPEPFNLLMVSNVYV